MNKTMPGQLVVNWHILEACNFRCRYCFAHWPKSSAREIWRFPQRWEKLLTEIQESPKHVPGEWNGIRLNLAGGEPLLLWRNGRGPLGKIMAHADELGFALSIISNGYLMDDAFIKAWAPKLQILGISADSADAGINAKIGRCDTSGKQISIQRIAEIFQLARARHPGIECKLNTVINAENWRCDLRPLLEATQPDRWKVFKMLPVADTSGISTKQAPLKISDGRFMSFLDRHKDFSGVMASEDNGEMTESYLMVDPWGRFYQNEPDGFDYRHVVSAPVHKVGIAKAFDKIEFNQIKFNRRYTSPGTSPEPHVDRQEAIQPAAGVGGRKHRRKTTACYPPSSKFRSAPRVSMIRGLCLAMRG